jgi:hypothetical protein
MPLSNGTTMVRANDESTPVLESIGMAAIEIGGLTLTKDTEEALFFDNQDGYKEHRGGMRDSGESNIKIEFDKDDRHHEKLLTDFNSDDTRQYGFQWPDSQKTQFLSDGIVSSFEITHESGSRVYANATIKWSGAPIWGAYT